MYRPEGWETLKAKNHPLHCFAPDACVGESFEAGADAMLSAIRERGFISGESLCNVKDAIGWASISPKSKWYPIPDD